MEQKKTTKTHRLVAWVLVLSFSLLSLLFNIGGRTLENKDYLKYAEIGREILETGDWTILHENGSLYVQKPPLHFWKIALSYKAMGVSPGASRMPSAIMAFIAIIATLIFTWKTTKRSRAATLSSLVLLSSYGFFFFSRRTRIDIEFSTLFSLSLMFFYLTLTGKKEKYMMSSLFWLTTGFMFMDKGPACFLNMVPATIFTGFMAKRGTRVRIRPLLITLPLVFIPAAPWIYKLINHPSFQEYLLKLKTSKIMTRNAGIFYYIPEIIAKFSPGVLFLIPSITAIRKWHEKEDAKLFSFLMIWVISYFIVINLTHVKNHRYLLPIFVPMSILTGWGLDIAIERNLYRKFLKISEIVFFATYTLCFMLSPFIAIKIFKTAPIKLVFLSIISIGTIICLWKKKVEFLIPFIGATLIYLHMDVIDTLNNTKASEVKKIYVTLEKNGITKPEDLCFVKSCGSRIREVLSFYYNRLITCTLKPEEAKRFRAVIVESKNESLIKDIPTKDIITLNLKKGKRVIYIILTGDEK